MYNRGALLEQLFYEVPPFSSYSAQWEAMSAGDAEAAVRWEFCRLDFFGTFLIKQKSTEEINKYNADGGDRFRTAAVGMNFGPFNINLNMFTGDPGLDMDFRRDHHGVDANRNKYYTGLTANNARMRAGVLSFGFGPLRFGGNSEAIRHAFQNRFAHDFLMHGQTKDGPYWFMINNGISPSGFFYFGLGSGNTLW
jgi:hypothetical protein